jgi:hypothetical protein
MAKPLFAAPFCKRRKSFAVAAPSPKHNTTSSAAPVELSMSQVYPSTPHGEDERYSVFDEEDSVDAPVGSPTVIDSFIPQLVPSGQRGLSTFFFFFFSRPPADII